MKHFLRPMLVAGLLKLAVVSAHAQGVAPAPATAPAAPASAVPAAAPATDVLLAPTLVPSKYKDYLNKRYAADKEARAAVHMFSRKQTGGALWLAGGAAFLGFVVSQTGTKSDASGTTTVTVSPLGYVIFAGLPAGLAIGKFSRFNNGELYKMLLEYDKTHTLPGYVIAKLGKSDYQ